MRSKGPNHEHSPKFNQSRAQAPSISADSLTAGAYSVRVAPPRRTDSTAAMSAGMAEVKVEQMQMKQMKRVWQRLLSQLRKPLDRTCECSDPIRNKTARR